MTVIRIDDRGLADYADFLDGYGKKVLVRDSSAAKGRWCWVFLHGEGIVDPDAQPKQVGRSFTHVIDCHMGAHLDKERARTLRDALTAWLGDAPGPSPPR